MRKKHIKGFSMEQLESMTPAQRQIKQRDLEKERLEVIKEMERLVTDISKKKHGKPLPLINPKRIGRRPNDLREE